MQQPVKIGIIGSGFGALVQLPAFLKIPDVQVMGITSEKSNKGKELAATHHLPYQFETWQELIACPDIELVSITAPPFAHKEIAEVAIAAKKAVLCEKPFTRNSAEALHLFNLAEEAGIVHATDFEFRELGSWSALHAEVQQGKVGKIQRASLEWSVGTWAKLDRPWQWQCDASMEGGVIGALGVHLFDAAELLLGPMQTVTATMGTKIKERKDESGKMKAVTAEDHAEIHLHTASGIPVTITLSNVEKDGKGLTMQLIGEHGVLVLESLSQDYARGIRVVEMIGKEPSRIVVEETNEDIVDARIRPFQAFARKLIASVQRKDRDFHPSFAEGLRATMIRAAAIRSAKVGGHIDIGHIQK